MLAPHSSGILPCSTLRSNVFQVHVNGRVGNTNPFSHKGSLTISTAITPAGATGSCDVRAQTCSPVDWASDRKRNNATTAEGGIAKASKNVTLTKTRCSFDSAETDTGNASHSTSPLENSENFGSTAGDLNTGADWLKADVLDIWTSDRCRCPEIERTDRRVGYIKCEFGS